MPVNRTLYAKDMNCPRCKEKMAPTNCSCIPANTCLYCNGMWINSESFGRLLNLDPQAPSKHELQKSFELQHDNGSKRQCPSCSGESLNQIHVHSVELDLCPKCSGLFFDEGEIKNILPSASKPSNELGAGDYVATEGLFWVLMGVLSGGC